MSPPKPIIPLADVIKNRKNILLGHIIRAHAKDEQDPMYNISFLHHGTKIRTKANRRVGRPRAKWIHETFKNAWESSQNSQYTDTEEQRATLFTMAKRGMAPFFQKKRQQTEESRNLDRNNQNTLNL